MHTCTLTLLSSVQAAQRALHFPESAARRLSIEAILRYVWWRGRKAWMLHFPSLCLVPSCVLHVGKSCSRSPVFSAIEMQHCPLPLHPGPLACRGHHGCVNRLNWNESGSLLASGSDDRKASRPSVGYLSFVGSAPALTAVEVKTLG